MTQNSAQFSQLDFCEKKNLKEDNISKSTQAFSKFIGLQKTLDKLSIIIPPKSLNGTILYLKGLLTSIINPISKKT